MTENIPQAPHPVALPLLVSVGITLAYMAQLTPISGGYFSAFLMLTWMVLRRKHWPIPPPHLILKEVQFRRKMRPLNWGIGLFVGLQVISALGSYFTTLSEPNFKETLHATMHLVGKWLLLWLVISQAFALLVRFGWQPRMVAKHLSIWVFVYFFYCLAQRAWGLDWARGFDHTLGSNRFAYGVFRVSGLMSHPLTLAYNLLLMLFTAVALTSQKQSGPAKPLFHVVYSWGFIAVMCLILLLISGSRFVLLLIPLAFLLAYTSRLGPMLESFRNLAQREAKLFWGVLSAASIGSLALLSLLGASTWSRFSELFDPSIPWEQRWPRIIYWKIHWQLFLDHPVFGVSVSQVSLAAKKSIIQLGNPLESMNAHNMFLQTLADSGIVGLLGLMILFISILKTMKSPLLGPSSQRGFTLVFVGLLGASMVQNVLRDSEFVFCLWMSLATLLALTEEESESLPCVP